MSIENLILEVDEKIKAGEISFRNAWEHFREKAAAFIETVEEDAEHLLGIEDSDENDAMPDATARVVDTPDESNPVPVADTGTPQETVEEDADAPPETVQAAQ